MLIHPGGSQNSVYDMPKSKIEKLRRTMLRLTMTSRMRTMTRRPPSTRDETLLFLAQLLSITWVLHTFCMPVWADNYWAFAPNPPLLHPMSWGDNDDVTVYVNNTRVLSFPSSTHIQPISIVYNYTGMSASLPLCFSKTNKNCTLIERYSDWDGNFTNGMHWGVDMMYVFCNSSETRVGKRNPPEHIPECRQKYPSKSVYGLSRHLCHHNYTICYKDLCDWSSSIYHHDNNFSILCENCCWANEKCAFGLETF
ncbi:uncharacterized protein LOC134475761 [Cavia porcellus]|uniref:uncharacterized protein LOC134475761 n=1 Tax=Cavia porcellus TaxID=10141 RepID=UPI002FDF2E3C